MKKTAGTFGLKYEMYENPDQLDIFYRDDVIFTTGGLVSNNATRAVHYAEASQLVTVVVWAPNDGTEWNYQVSCP